MKFAMKKFFRRSKKSSEPPQPTDFSTYGGYGRDDHHSYNSRQNGYQNGYQNNYQNNYAGIDAGRGRVFAPWLELPPPILERVFSFVCPHCCDESYETCEQSALEDACMLCDLRDLSHAGQVCKRWRVAAVKLMYHSIRIDSVHYCELEIDLSEKRKRRSRFDRNGLPEDTANARLQLLCRSLREDPTRLGKLVQYFKTPYMLRESSSSTLARTIAVLPNLRYVDLPEGLYCDDPAYHTLKLEVQARCPDLRKMAYTGGSERSLEALSTGSFWQNLEVVELTRISMDPAALRHVLAVLQRLRALKVTDCRIIDDDIFRYNDVLPAFPALEEIILIDTPRVTADGLVAYLSRDDTQRQLKVLSLSNTGVQAPNLYTVLAQAPNLTALSVIDQVDSVFPSHSIPPLVNWSLQTLRYEITASSATPAYVGLTAGYYNYLASSLFAGGLPRLSAVYVRDQNFPDLLLGLPPPMPSFAGGQQRPSSSSSAAMFNVGNGLPSPGLTGSFSNASPRFSSNNPFAAALGPSKTGTRLLSQSLEVFTKGEDDLDWGSIRMDPFDAYNGMSNGRKGHRSNGSLSGRPLSSYGLADVGSGWQSGGSRKGSLSQAMGHLSVPAGHARNGSTASSSSLRDDAWPRPGSSHGKKKGDRDLWR
ncbi:uncharacterized protein F4812DRAFT_445249 [Daldinia caldariorum]|uniref:uncharacterized protein n=1 Tax=Daldinia caldariorum TaxID=326644 RepID=UPI00200852DD|nr:uncharacterized protein F4812DRAFT_445249 [Daldinia caldariorum]KAI1463756.1 hypothetical protein F4812DRAFT_445249 [Daldinia caldariorum]